MDNPAPVLTPSTPSSSSTSPRHAKREEKWLDQEQSDAHPNSSSRRRIQVTGYPNYTQPQDLLDVFAKFGNVRIDRCNSWTATLTYLSEQEVKAAVGASGRVHIYGRYLTVRLAGERGAGGERGERRAEARHAPNTPKREFPMSKKKGVIIEPKKIDLSGDFHNQLDNILSAVRLTQENVKSLGLLFTDLENALQSLWPACKAVPFGSITTGLGIKTSDADCFISIPDALRSAADNAVSKARRVLLQFPRTFAELLAIPRANTPIVKFFHVPTGTNCDVTFKTPLGAQNSRLVAFLLHADPRLLPVAVLIKYWAKVHDLSGTGKLTNYALTLMIIFYLQQPPMSILPSIRWLQSDPSKACIVDYWNTGFMSDPALLPPSSNTSSISELLGGFFEYYAMFNFDEMVVCPFLGVPVKKALFNDLATVPDEFECYKKNVANKYVLPLRFQPSFCVQDPFEQCHNVASTITSKLALDIKTYFKFAANAYEKEKLNACQEFLKIILLQRPKLIRGKTHPEYRVNLFPRIINTIISFDWKTVVREVVMEIFENMLKIKLNKLEEKVNADTKKEKEKFMGTVTKPVWKRKSFQKLYNIDRMSFEEKQRKITEEIMNAEKTILSVQFQLTLTFCHEPKSAVVSIRLGTGNIDMFREFGKFFISVMQSWFMQLLKPHSMPNCKDTAAKIAETMETEGNENEIDTDDDVDEENVITPKTQPVDEIPVKKDIEEASTENTDEILTANSVDTLNNYHANTSPKKITETSITCIEQSLAEKALAVTPSADILPTTATNLTKNVETFMKNAETLIKNAVNDTPTDSASDVSVVCAPE